MRFQKLSVGGAMRCLKTTKGRRTLKLMLADSLQRAANPSED